MNSEHFGANLGLTDGKYFRKFIFEFKVEIGIFEMSIRLNFSNFWAFLILGEIGPSNWSIFDKNYFDIKLRSA